MSMAQYKQLYDIASPNDEEKNSKRKGKRRGGLLRMICSDRFDDTNFSACTSDGNTMTDKTQLCENKEGLTVVHLGHVVTVNAIKCVEQNLKKVAKVMQLGL